MKKILFILTLFVGSMAVAQENPVKIVFDVTSADEGVHQTAMRHIKMMSAAYPDSEFELVVYSGAINMVTDGKSSVQDDIIALSENDNVQIKVCDGTMKRKGITTNELLPGVGTVPDGILEIVTKQGQGWGYIKEAPNH